MQQTTQITHNQLPTTNRHSTAQPTNHPDHHVAAQPPLTATHRRSSSSLMEGACSSSTVPPETDLDLDSDLVRALFLGDLDLDLDPDS